MYSEELKELLESNPNILSVWIDSDENWHTHEVEGKEVKREDILIPKKSKKDESK